MILNELWLRMHRVLIHGLETARLWPAIETYDVFHQEHWTLREKLKSDLLSQVLGQTDSACLGSARIFGPSSQYFGSKIINSLAVGYELGYGVSSLLRAPVTATENAARLSGVFNLGISVFDLICDNYPDLLVHLSETFNEGVLCSLAEDPGACRQFSHDVALASSPELRVLLKIIAWFFTACHRAGPAEPAYRSGQQLSPLLLSAYRAELATVCASGQSSELLIEIARDKSTLPVGIIFQIARLNSGPLQTELGRAFEAMANRVGEAFWLMDDVVDIDSDLRTGSLNSVLVKAGICPTRPWELSNKYGGLVKLIEGCYIEDTVDSLLRSLASAAHLARYAPFEAASAACFLQMVLGIMRQCIP